MTSRGTWRRRSRSNSALLLAALVVSACGAAGSSSSVERAGLAFTRGEDEAWVADADGSNARQLVANAWTGNLSSNGRYVAYHMSSADDSDDHLTSLYVQAVGGGKPLRIGETSWSRWAPDGTHLAFTNGDSVFLVDVESGKRQEVVQGDVTGWNALSFAPDGNSLVFARNDSRPGHDGESNLFVLRLSDGKLEQLTRDGHDDTPVWGGEWIAYRHFRYVNDDHWPSIGQIWLIRRDGSSDHLLARGDENTSEAHYGIEPVELTADGKRLLACYSHEFGCPPVTLTVPGGDRHDLSFGGRDDLTAMDLAADGTQALVTTGLHEGPYDVYAVPFEGGAPRLLAKNAVSPSWAP